MSRGRLLSFWRDQAAASAVEFALVVPVFFALTIGALNFCILLYINSTLHYAVDDAARCMSVKTTVCDTASPYTLTKAHAAAVFNFPSLSPSFTPNSAAACGNQVTGTATYRLNVVVTSLNLTVTAQSCFPKQN